MVAMAIPLTVQDIPAADLALRCSLPLIFRDSELPDYPGVFGTAFAISYNEQVVFLTARHVLGEMDENFIITVPTLFAPVWREIEMEALSFRTPRQAEFRDVADIAILYPRDAPKTVMNECAPYDASGWTADLSLCREGSLLVTRGYPRGVPSNSVNQETLSFSFLAHAVFGTYQGTSGLNGVHKMKTDVSEVGGAQGYSGSPVFRVVLENGQWRVGLAGMVVRGGDKVLHFLDVKALHKYLASQLGPLATIVVGQ